MNLQRNRTHLVHAVVVNANDRAIADYTKQFFISMNLPSTTSSEILYAVGMLNFFRKVVFYNRFGS